NDKQPPFFVHLYSTHALCSRFQARGGLYKLSTKEYISTDNLDLLLHVLPMHIQDALHAAGNLETLIEIVLDLGRLPEARYHDSALYLTQSSIHHDDIRFVASRVGNFTRDNRAGIERTLHRISAIR